MSKTCSSSSSMEIGKMRVPLLKDPVLEVTYGIGNFLKSGLALKDVFTCVAEIRVLLVADKLHRSSVETIAAYMLLAPTYDLHVVQFYESVVR